MPELFNSEEVDLSQIYRDSAAPKDLDPAEALFGAISSAAQAATGTTGGSATGTVGQSTTTRPSVTNTLAAGRGPSGIPEGPGPGVSRPAGNPASGPSSDTMSVLARLKPLGITSFNQVRGKSDVELRKLSQDVVTYELRQQSLTKFFKQNADGSWDFTTGPDGQPTGLDANGKPAQAAAAAAPASSPAPAPAAAAAPAPKPAAATAPKPAAKTAPKPATSTTARKTGSTTTSRTSTTRSSGSTTSRVVQPAPRPTTTTKTTTSRTSPPLVRPGQASVAS